MPLSELEKSHIRRLSGHEKAKCEQIVRTFCAELSGLKLATDGQIAGWHQWRSSLSPEAQDAIENHYQWACAKIVLRGEDEGTVIARGVASCKHKIATVRREPIEYADGRDANEIMRILAGKFGWD